MNRGLLLGLGTLALLGGCFKEVAGGPASSAETNIVACTDGRDNDRDGLIDCLDEDCVSRNFCGEIVPILPPSGFEGNLESCLDRVDNDLDGQFDCGDRDCQAIGELCCVTEIDDASCSNGVDDDGNGFADCGDFACRNGLFVTVCEAEDASCPEGDTACHDRLCSDGLDNDGDRQTDANDPDCIEESTAELCVDGIDNDGNGFTDCGDFSCCDTMGTCIAPSVRTYCDNLPPGVEETTTALCTDGLDNDDDGFFDCGTFDCCDRDGVCINDDVQSYCDDPGRNENTLESCTDGVDNDDDGYTDCEDNSCASPDGCFEGTLEERRACWAANAELRRLCESSFTSCNDGVDNEGDGFKDCADFSCQDPVPVDRDGDGIYEDTASPCQESYFAGSRDDYPSEASFIIAQYRDVAGACGDGVDNDADGFTDCEDWDCQWNPVLINPANTDQRFCTGYRFNVIDSVWEETPIREGSPAPQNFPILCR